MTNWTADDLFRWWIAQQQTTVMMLLGKIANPVTGQVERDLDMARLLIDLLAAMETKTQGNLSGDDERLLGGILTNLRLNFVQEANRPDPPAADADATAGAPAPGDVDQESSRAAGDHTVGDTVAGEPAAGDAVTGSSAGDAGHRS
jgi:hypothetical protein